MKPVDGPFAPLEPPRGRGWSVFIDELRVPARIGIHPHEHDAPQPVVIDARLGYRCEPAERGASGYIDYDGYCARVAAWLAHKPHTRLLETLVAELAALSFDEWPALESITLALHKPEIRPGTRRVGVELDWTRADYAAWRAALETRARGLATAAMGGYGEMATH
ncbi:dihydroneopterin aldolase [Burkholderia plantarii]|uniref:Dihydroneopterin aldolase n=1 Tax=Burkholderia plantarii TaxID=41899 RepID=A0A0B6RZA1_BURPL|nr:dihydroneopterin aldolase [Burkholderia plantarii]AJK48728.1 dihydroneopterin aldolase [Burkholderia plantarii]WLE62044.1 dihydroneopterin aldolase [Burkholderia plantarii]